ncbi:hypothetical protein [Streptomyces spectabilis]|uniref:Uncharacterized protein n=1 Tax=Streptomyces spectabilis TaxID=68270 RepID=A0A516RDN1_STRST|nr:hypothetical protein [Streptomyces spectabilis]QDQ13763.1 hypothetical protein FH965_27025 [Streptomyces spectabilis]
MRTALPDRVLGVCGHWTTAPIPVGEVRCRGGGWCTQYVCPDCVLTSHYRLGPQWDDLPARLHRPRSPHAGGEPR